MEINKPGLNYISPIHGLFTKTLTKNSIILTAWKIESL